MKAKIKQHLFVGEIVRKENDGEYKVIAINYVLNDRYNNRIEKRKWKDGYVYYLASLTNKEITIRVVGFYCMNNRKRTSLLGDVINYQVIQTVEERLWNL